MFSLAFAVWLAPLLQASELDDPRIHQERIWSTPEWGYAGKSGPNAWHNLPDSAACEDGENQSPIAIEPGWNNIFSNTTTDSKLTAFTPKWVGAPLQIVNNGHTIQVLHDPGSTIELDGVKYGLLQFHFHSPSEHILNEKEYPMEMHFVHTSLDPAHPGTAVVGVLVDKGIYNPELAKIWKEVPTQVDATKVVSPSDVTTNPIAFLPLLKNYVRYEGSLTTPPCTEGVHWVVYTHSIGASADQLRQLQGWLKTTNDRPIQAVNGRKLLLK